MQKDVSLDWIWSCSLKGNSFLCYDDNSYLAVQFDTQVSTTMSAGIFQELHVHALYISSEGC